jgi:hypothetical protein
MRRELSNCRSFTGKMLIGGQITKVWDSNTERYQKILVICDPLRQI